MFALEEKYNNLKEKLEQLEHADFCLEMKDNWSVKDSEIHRQNLLEIEELRTKLAELKEALNINEG